MHRREDLEGAFLQSVSGLEKYVSSSLHILRRLTVIAYAYCQDGETGVVYLHGDGKNLANMDVDCDGDQSDHGDGRCGTSDDTQSITAFQYQVHQYSVANGGNVSDLNANFIP